jgi:hypothetical protein
MDGREGGWQELTPFEILIKGFKIKSSPPVSFKKRKWAEEEEGERER